MNVIKELPAVFDATCRTVCVLERIGLNCVICFREHVSCRTDFGFIGIVNGRERMFISDRLFLSTFIKVNISGTMLKPIPIRELLDLMTPEDAYTFFEGKSLKATGLQQIEIPEFNRVTGERIGTRIVIRAVLEII